MVAKSSVEKPVPGLEFETFPDTGVLLARILGGVDRSDLSAAEQCLREMLERGFVRVIADLSLAERLGSSAMGLLSWYRIELARRGGMLVLVNPPAVLRRMLKGTDIGQIFKVADSVEAAMRVAAGGG
jgi:anti-anti-sigma factor